MTFASVTHLIGMVSPCRFTYQVLSLLCQALYNFIFSQNELEQSTKYKANWGNEKTSCGQN